MSLFSQISYRTWHNMAKDIAMYLLNQYILCPLSSYCPPPVVVLSKPCHRIVQALSSYCPSPVVVLSKPSRRILYLFVLRQKHPSSDKNILCLPVSQIFSLYLQHRFATTAVVRNDFIEKVLLKLSSFSKFSQSL